MTNLLHKIMQPDRLVGIAWHLHIVPAAEREGRRRGHFGKRGEEWWWRCWAWCGAGCSSSSSTGVWPARPTVPAVHTLAMVWWIQRLHDLTAWSIMSHAATQLGHLLLLLLPQPHTCFPSHCHTSLLPSHYLVTPLCLPACAQRKCEIVVIRMYNTAILYTTGP